MMLLEVKPFGSSATLLIMMKSILTLRVAAWNHVARFIDTVRRTVGDHNDNPRRVGPPRGAADGIERVQLGFRSVPATRSDETSQLALDIAGGGHERLGVVDHPRIALLTVVAEGHDAETY